jgi:8-oxo-dGTP pyrophosphatase MutT (NUDIX family)
MQRDLDTFVQGACMFDPADSLVPFTVEGVLVGWMRRAFAERLNEWPEYFSVRPRGVGMLGDFETALHRSVAIAEVVESLATETVISGWRGELVTVAETFYSPPLFHIERAASRYFGLTMHASHLNGLTTRNGELQMWIAQRADSKSVDAGKLDNLVGGRIARGMSPIETLVKESFEEAGIPPALAKTATGAGVVRCKREVKEGMHNELIFVHDLMLPESFVPKNQDGEVSRFECVPIAEMLDRLEGNPDEFTDDAVLVALDCLIRHGLFTSERSDYLEVIHALRP